MGDMEQYEARMCHRDAVIDQYNDWLDDYIWANEPRSLLISWKQFNIQCWRCELTYTVFKVGANSYQLDCGHIADRFTVDQNILAEAALDAKLADCYGDSDRYWYHCPVHLVKVRIDDVHGSMRFGDRLTYQLSCGCLIDEAPDRMECHQCPLIDGVAVPMPRVTGRGGIIEARRDATQTYELECGHVAF